MVRGRYRAFNEEAKPFQNFFFVRDCNDCRQLSRGARQVAARYSDGDFTDDDIIGTRFMVDY